MNETGPSERAVEAAYGCQKMGSPEFIERVLAAAHDPKLGLDRSVCLRDVLQMLKDGGGWREGTPEYAVFVRTADFIERSFTEEAGSDG